MAWRSYSLPQVLSVGMVSLGIVTVTLADGMAKLRATHAGGSVAPGCCGAASGCAAGAPRCATAGFMASLLPEGDAEFMAWATGIALLSVALLASALMGHVQQRTYTASRAKYDKSPHTEVGHAAQHTLPHPHCCTG